MSSDMMGDSRVTTEGKLDGTELEDLERRLGLARRRWFISRLFVGFLWSVAAAGVAAVLTSLIHTSAVSGLGILVVVGTLGLGLLVSVVVAWIATPTPADAVVRIDRAYGMKSQLSTAREEALRSTGTTPAHSVLRRALLNEATRLTANVRPREVVPMRIGKAHVAAAAVTLVAVAAAGTLQFGSPDPTDSMASLATEAASEAFGDEGRNVLADELRRLADAITREAREQGDPYMGAISEAARDLSDDVSEGSVNPRDTLRQFERLTAQLAEASGGRFSAEGLQEQIGEELEPSESLNGERADQAIEGNEDRTVLDEMLDQAARLRGDFEQARKRRERMENPYGDPISPEERVGSAIRNQRAGAAVEGEAAGDPAGPASESTDAPGDAAGAGSRGLEQGEAREEGEFESIEDVNLPEADASGQGARVRAAGEPQSGEAVDEAGGGGASQSRGDGKGAGVTSVPEPAKGGVRDEEGYWRQSTLSPTARMLASRLLEPKTDRDAE